MQTAELLDDRLSRPEGKVIGVRQEHPAPGLREQFGHNPLDRPLGADGHENRRLDGTMRGVQQAGSGGRSGVDGEQLEADGGGH